MLVNTKRIFALNDAPLSNGPIVYWMSREQRIHDNWGLLHAQELASSDRSLIVVFCLAPSFLGATLRQYDFMLHGLEEVAEELSSLNIPFSLCIGEPSKEITRIVKQVGAGAVVTDFDPLRIKQKWQKEVASTIDVPLIEVDGHNIVPARYVSDKQEYAARTIRPKIQRISQEFLEDYPTLKPLKQQADLKKTDWSFVWRSIVVDDSVKPVELLSGEKAARRALSFFINTNLQGYAVKRNDPNSEGTSRLSAYFHFGQLSPQRAALEVASSGRGEDQATYLEELIIRRELADNFCLHNPDYDSLQGAPAWALKTLKEHEHDPRDFTYSFKQFEHAKTHSRLWNSAQNQLKLILG